MLYLNKKLKKEALVLTPIIICVILYVVIIAAVCWSSAVSASKMSYKEQDIFMERYEREQERQQAKR